MNLRNYNEAKKCLNAALEYANDNFPDIVILFPFLSDFVNISLTKA